MRRISGNRTLCYCDFCGFTVNILISQIKLNGYHLDAVSLADFSSMARLEVYFPVSGNNWLTRQFNKLDASRHAVLIKALK